jgi:DNA-binding response OmpR family regulator/chromosome segregation ATPase
MSIKVLVFESDPAFAGELRNELGKLGCTTTVVDDGNVGLQQASSDRPDLILLSIELPRMNGFSVCNKLKKDPGLKDVPLIIMSTESSEETFEQHKKLRTRAEDYVHKPISFGELLEHIQAFVGIGAPASEGEAAIVIDDEIEIGSTDYEIEDDPTASLEPQLAPQLEPLLEAQAPPPAGSSASAVGGTGHGLEGDVDAFAESAFGRLTGAERAAPRVAPINGASESLAQAVPRRVSTAPTPLRVPSVRPPATVDVADYDRLREELVRIREQATTAEGELREARAEIDKLRIDVGETERLTGEVDELRAKLVSAAKAGGISSREFLDVREALNRKDKEILSLKEQLARKDREIIEAQDKQLAFERTKADVEERLLGLERALTEARENAESFASERDLAKRASEDARTRIEKARADADARDRQLAELRSRHADEIAARDTKLATLRAELDQVLANERAEHARMVDQAEQQRRSDLEQARRDREAAVAEARDQAQREAQEVLGASRRDAEEKLADAQRREQAALESIRADHARELGEADERQAKLETDLSETRGELESLRASKTADDASHTERVAEMERRLSDAQNARDDFGTRLAGSNEKVGSLEAQLATVQQELSETKEKLGIETSRADKAHAKWDSDRQSLERAKDALAVALAQIEEAENRSLP